MMIQKVNEKEKVNPYYRFEEYIEADQVEIAFLKKQIENKDRIIANKTKIIAKMDKINADMYKIIEELRKDNENLRIQLKYNESH